MNEASPLAKNGPQTSNDGDNPTANPKQGRGIETASSVPRPPAIRPSANPLSMPSRSGTRGNAISIPTGSRVVPTTAPILATVSINSATERPLSPPVDPQTATAQNINTDVPPTVDSSQPNSVQRKGRKRKTMEDPRPQDPELDQSTVEPAKKRRQTRSAAKTRASKPAAKRERTPKTSRSRPAEEDNRNQATHEETPTQGEGRGDGDGGESIIVRRPRRQRKARPRVDKPANSIPEEGEPLDETTMTMRDLCNGMGKGRVSGRYLETFAESNEATKRKRGDNLRLKELTRRKELGLPLEDDEALALGTRRRGASLSRAVSQLQPSREANEAQERTGGDEEEEDEYAGVAVTTRAPKVRYDANGNLVLDETQLQFDRQAEADQELAARGPMEVIVETDRGRFTNHASYSRKPRVERWSKDETETFYTVRRFICTRSELT